MPILALAILSVFIVSACDYGQVSPDHVSINEDEEESYLVGTVFTPPIYSQGFLNGHIEIDEEGYKYEFSPKQIGHIHLPSGQLVITEPLYFYDQEPMTVRLKPGRYTVILAEALIYEDSKVADKRNALVKIVIDSGIAESWEYVWSFGADGGTGGYIDYQVMQKIISDGKQDEFAERLLKEFERVYQVPQPFHEHHEAYQQYVDLSYGEGNLLAFSSGWGDGGYNSYIGYDKNGKPVEILTDLSVIYWNDKEHLQARGTGSSRAEPSL